jgi:hypothetical protein
MFEIKNSPFIYFHPFPLPNSNINAINTNTEAFLVAHKEDGLEVNAEGTGRVFVAVERMWDRILS